MEQEREGGKERDLLEMSNITYLGLWRAPSYCARVQTGPMDQSGTQESIMSSLRQMLVASHPRMWLSVEGGRLLPRSPVPRPAVSPPGIEGVVALALGQVGLVRSLGQSSLTPVCGLQKKKKCASLHRRSLHRDYWRETEAVTVRRTRRQLGMG